MNNLPCLFIGFARERGLINALQSAMKAGLKNFYVSLDGPTSNRIELIQSRIVTELTRVSEEHGVEIKVQILDENLGSGVAVISAIDWFMTHEEAGIVLEDDLEVGIDFFRFVTETLDFHWDDTDVLSISGFNPFASDKTKSKNLKVSYPVSWGWSTTRVKWNKSRQMLFDRVSTRSWKHPVLASYWKTGKSRSLSGKIDAWDVPLASSMRFAHFNTVLPPVNLVTNVGYDIDSSHTKKMDWPLGISKDKLPSGWKPTEISEMQDITDAFESKIYKIQIRHILSLPASKIFDYFRFKNHREAMLLKLNNHTKRQFTLGKEVM